MTMTTSTMMSRAAGAVRPAGAACGPAGEDLAGAAPPVPDSGSPPLTADTFATRFLLGRRWSRGGLERGLALRFAASLSLASLYGLALGTRYGAAAMLQHAVGVPLALVAVALLGGPMFYILLAHSGSDLGARPLAAAVTGAAATTALVLAGLAPAVVLLTVSAESDASAALVGGLGLLAAGGLGLRRLGQGLRAELAAPDGRLSLLAGTALAAFTLFAAVLAGRIWWLLLPMLGGS